MIIIPKRSVILGHVPTPEQLEEGEIAINIADGGEKIYVKNAEGKIVLLGGSELYTLIKEARDHVDSSLTAHNSSLTAHSDIREAITLTYTKNEENGDVLLKSVKSDEVLYPQTLETEVLDEQGISLDTNLGKIRSDVEKRNLYYTDSETGLGNIPEKVDGTSLTLGNFPVPSEIEEITPTDTVSSAIGKLYKMIKG
jgi:hypothetical protein